MITVTGILREDPEDKKQKKPKKIWDNYAELFEVQKSDRIKLVVAAGVRDGVKYINVREFYLKISEGVWKPGRDGITVPIKMPIEKGAKIIEPAEAFIEAIKMTVEHLVDMPLADPVYCSSVYTVPVPVSVP